MKTPSRYLPAYVPEPVTFLKKAVAYGVLILMAGALGYGVWSKPVSLAVLACLGLGAVFLQWNGNRKLKRLSASRNGESICTFARGFDLKSVDTWIIRAVHEELQVYVKYPGGTCPLRSTDRLIEDLNIDPDDIDDLFPVIAQRTGRSINNTKSNPYYCEVNTVGDLVHFVNCQPMERGQT